MNAAQWHLPSRLVAVDASADEGGESEEAARRVVQAIAAEPSGLLFRPSELGRKVLAFLPPEVPVVAVLPDLPKLLRDVAARGAVHAALGRLAGAGIGTWARLAMTTMRNARRVVVQDLEGLLPVLIELAALAGRAVSGVALSAPLTDLLLAAGHRDCFAHVVTFLRRQVGTRAGFETLNLGHLLNRLDSWDIMPDFVIGPLNPCGSHMKPSEQAVLESVRASQIPVLAAEVTAGGTVSLTDGIAYARQSGAAGVVLAFREVAGQVPFTTPAPLGHPT